MRASRTTAPRGNRDPDTDPDAFMLSTDGGTSRRTIACRW
jgi:hypothetical protein